jgi:hypothetical protein
MKEFSFDSITDHPNRLIISNLNHISASQRCKTFQFILQQKLIPIYQPFIHLHLHWALKIPIPISFQSILVQLIQYPSLHSSIIDPIISALDPHLDSQLLSSVLSLLSNREFLFIYPKIYPKLLDLVIQCPFEVIRLAASQILLNPLHLHHWKIPDSFYSAFELCNHEKTVTRLQGAMCMQLLAQKASIQRKNNEFIFIELENSNHVNDWIDFFFSQLEIQFNAVALDLSMLSKGYPMHGMLESIVLVHRIEKETIIQYLPLLEKCAKFCTLGLCNNLNLNDQIKSCLWRSLKNICIILSSHCTIQECKRVCELMIEILVSTPHWGAANSIQSSFLEFCSRVASLDSTFNEFLESKLFDLVSNLDSKKIARLDQKSVGLGRCVVSILNASKCFKSQSDLLDLGKQVSLCFKNLKPVFFKKLMVKDISQHSLFIDSR